jgi:hypothetical protein
MPEKGATHKASPSQSYKKCSNVPSNEVTANPISCQSPIDRFIIHLEKQIQIKYIQRSFFYTFLLTGGRIIDIINYEYNNEMQILTKTNHMRGIK